MKQTQWWKKALSTKSIHAVFVTATEMVSVI